MKFVTVRIPDDLHDRLRLLAFQNRVSMNAIILRAVANLDIRLIVAEEKEPMRRRSTSDTEGSHEA